jgi:hypothetical protein
MYKCVYLHLVAFMNTVRASVGRLFPADSRISGQIFAVASESPEQNLIPKGTFRILQTLRGLQTLC